MHIWKIEPLSKELALGLISEKTAMQYFLASTLIGILATYYSLWLGVVRDWIFYFEIVAISVISIFGCLQAFEANGSESGNSFIHRAICLSVPAGIRANLLSVAFGVVMYYSFEHVFTGENFGDPLRAYALLSYAAFVGISIYYWVLLVRGFKWVKIHEPKT